MFSYDFRGEFEVMTFFVLASLTFWNQSMAARNSETFEPFNCNGTFELKWTESYKVTLQKLHIWFYTLREWVEEVKLEMRSEVNEVNELFDS